MPRGTEGRNVTPRDAASLVLLRGDGDGLEVLMGRRPDTARFMPGVFVFPGGAVDPDDLAIANALGADDATLGALALCAVRETWEETGVIVGKRGRESFFDDPDATEETRQFLDDCALAGVRPAPERLLYFCHAITPELSPIRFDTRFFLCHENDTTGTARATGELPEVRWVRCTDTLAAANVSGITKRVLREALRLLSKPTELVDPGRLVAQVIYHDSGYRIRRSQRGSELDRLWPRDQPGCFWTRRSP